MIVTGHALIIGKFHPPHNGHEFLVRTAASASEQVSVLVLAHPDETIPLTDRVAWMREMLTDLSNVTVVGGIDPHPIDYENPAVWDQHEREFRATLATVTNRPVTAVFTSESYGKELAGRFEARHVSVDPGRLLVPISSTAVRNDPVGTWEQLPRPVQAGLCQRVVVLGAESTGTTTISRMLTESLRARGGAHGLTRWVPEVGRMVSVTKLAGARAQAALRDEPAPTMEDLAWPSAEFEAIAAEQNRIEDQLGREGGPILVCDTDAFATGIWHERYVGRRSAEVEALARRHPLYLLTHHDGVPFQQDGLRDGEHIRTWMTERFEDELIDSGRHFITLTGSISERLDQGLNAINQLIANGWEISGPGA